MYSKPPKRYGAQSVDDLSAHALSKIQLVGLPLRESHQKDRDLGKVTDQWQGPDGSLYVAFDIPERFDTQLQRAGVENGFYGHLSLSHRVGNPPEPLGECRRAKLLLEQRLTPPLAEVSICHNGRRKDCVINRSMDVSEYKRRTTQARNKEMSSANEPAAAAPATPAPAADTPMPDATTKAPEPSASDAAPAPPINFETLFEDICRKLPEDQRKVAIAGQTQVYKELERLQAELDRSKTEVDSKSIEEIAKLKAELDSTKKRTGDMEKMYEDNVRATISAMKNFFEQDGATPNVTGGASPDYALLDGALKANPEMARHLAPVISCAASRINSLETTLKVLQDENTKTSEERELFARMRGFHRDSAKPTYDYHGFENSKRPRVTENANTAAPPAEPTTAPPPPKRQRLIDSDQMNALRAAMKRATPARPSNIRTGELFR